MFGHRPDGKRLNNLDPIVQMTPYLMPMRCDAQVFLEHRADYETMSRYIAQKSQQGQKITFMQILVASYVRAVSRNPEVNRFIFNKQYYSRNNCSVSYTVLKNPQDTDSNEDTVRILFDLTDTIFDVRDRMNDAVEKSRATEDGDFVIRLASALLGVPGLATLVVSVVKLLDRYGIAPKVLLRELPFYSGMFITNNGSIGLHHPWHHIYNFGDVSLFIGMGTLVKEAFVENDGRVRMRRWLPLGITADERVCSGAHYAQFFFDIMHLLDNPEELETPPEEGRFDQGLEYHVPKVAKQEA
jgi:pyruvate/2-oxoglutarate dehydrogenase complex dihydrolipoamide acyltransferase (E2) component